MKKNKASLILGIAAALGTDFDTHFSPPAKNVWKPKFTDEELEKGRSLPKKERKKYLLKDHRKVIK